LHTVHVAGKSLGTTGNAFIQL